MFAAAHEEVRESRCAISKLLRPVPLICSQHLLISLLSHQRFSACSLHSSSCPAAESAALWFFFFQAQTLSNVRCSYGLLGPSGCGKTTLLKCIVGTLKISRGHITVLGRPPAFPGHGVPGKMVGYMPQVLPPGRFTAHPSILLDAVVMFKPVPA